MRKQVDTSNPNAWAGPEQFGYAPLFKNTKQRRGNGLSTVFGKGSIMEDVLNPPTKTIPRTEDTERVQQKGNLLFGAGNHGHYMDMRVDSVTHREMCTRFAQLFLLPFYLLSYVTFRIGGGMEWSEFDIFDYSFFAVILGLILFDFLRPIATPVRFNYKDQEVYAHHKGALYRIPWNECEIACMYSPDHMGIAGLADAYNLNLWLYPKHCVNGKAGDEPVALILNNTGPSHADIYNYWEYVRAFMTDGSDKVYTFEEEGSRAYFIDFSKISLSLILKLPLLLLIFFFTNPRKLYVWLNPIKKKWSKEVHEWTGEVRNWH